MTNFWMDKKVADENNIMNKTYFEQNTVDSFPYFYELYNIMNFVIQNFKKEKSFSCLDVCCGTGWQACYLEKTNIIKHLNYEGLDISSHMCEYAKQNCPNILFYVEDIFQFNPQKKWDIVLASGSFEMFPEWKDYLIKLTNNIVVIHKLFFTENNAPEQIIKHATYDGNEETRVIINYNEFVNMLNDINFEIIKKYDWDDKRVFGVAIRKKTMIEKDYLWWALPEVAKEHDDMNHSYFDKGEAGKYPYFDILHKMLAMVADMENQPFLSCLDIGCGAGWQAVHMSNVGLDKKIIYEGLDISESMCRLAKHNYPNGIFHVADIMEFNPEKQWDIIMACGSIEHFIDWKSFLKQISSLSNNWLMIHKVFFQADVNKKTEQLICPTYANRTQTRMVIQYSDFTDAIANLGFNIIKRTDWDVGAVSCVLAKRK